MMVMKMLMMAMMMTMTDDGDEDDHVYDNDGDNGFVISMLNDELVSVKCTQLVVSELESYPESILR